MGSRSKVKAHVDRAVRASKVEDKLNEIAKAIYELADFVDDIENKVNALR